MTRPAPQRPSYREALLGIPEAVQREVDADELAATRSPQALDARLEHLSAHELRARYRAELGRSTYPVPARAALEDFDRAEAAAEDAAIRRGGNR